MLKRNFIFASNRINSSNSIGKIVKRLLSILMLLVLLVVGVGPTVAMHYCGQGLRSVEILSQQESQSCCPIADDGVKNHDDCALEHKDCCETHKVQLVTDNYQLQERSQNIAPIFTQLEADWYTSSYTALLIEGDLTTLGREYFPPGGFDPKDVDILGFICILRI